MYTLIFNPGSLDTYTIGFELTVEELGGYQCNTQFLSIDSYDNNSIVNITLGDDISFSSNIISGSIKITFISQQTSSFTETITMRYNDSNNNINKTISQQIKMYNPLVDLSYYASKNIDNYQEITEIPQEHLEYLQSGLHASNMGDMFGGCEKLTTIPKLNIDTNECIDMTTMFFSCRSLTSLDLSNWNTGNVDTMSAMFALCSSLTSIDISNFDTSNVIFMTAMFDSCSSLTTITGIIDMKSCISYRNMFFNCTKLTNVKIKNPPAGFDGAGLSSSQYTIVS